MSEQKIIEMSFDFDETPNGYLIKVDIDGVYEEYTYTKDQKTEALIHKAKLTKLFEENEARIREQS